MTISELGSLGEFVGSLAVVVTLIYLTTQLRQNTKAVRAASTQALDRSITGNIARQTEHKRAWTCLHFAFHVEGDPPWKPI